jgi:hypothetical protein
VDEGHQDRQATRVRQLQDRTDLGRTGEPGQRRHPAGGNARGRWDVDTQGPDLAESKQGLDQRRTADLDRASAQAVECGVALTWGHPQQAFELGLLCQADVAREAAPQPQLHPAAQPCHMPLQDAAARQQHLVRHQPGRGPLEQHAGPVGAGPAQCVQPPRQAPPHQGFGDLDIAVLRADFGRVLPATLAGSVSIKSIDRRDMKLPSQRLHNGCRHLQRVGQERAQVADSAELDGEAQPVMVPSLARNPLQIDIVEVKVAVQIVRRWRTGVATVLLTLRVGEKADRHWLRLELGARPRSV